MSNRGKLDAVALLEADHRKVEGLFEQYKSTKSADKKEDALHPDLSGTDRSHEN